MALRTIERVTRSSNFSLMTVAPDRDPTLRVIIVSLGGQIDSDSSAMQLQEMYPAAYLIACLDTPDQNVWLEVERSGFNLVCSKGGLGPALRKAINDEDLTAVDRAIAVCDSASISGRLGHLMDVELPKLGEVSLWRVSGRLVCTGKCPHQNRSLAQGEMSESIITCPAHGSQFDLLTGERVRGPSDFDLTCYGAYEQNGRVWVLPN